MRLRRVFATALALALALASGCSSRTTGEAPVVSGAFHQIPSIAFPNAKAPSNLQTTILSRSAQEDPREVSSDDLLLVDYLGQVWDGDVFDSSFNRPTPVIWSLPDIGIPGLRQLAGAHVGDRVMLTIPADQAYGEDGNERLGIPKNATILYVVDILHAVNPVSATQDIPAATPLDPAPELAFGVSFDAQGTPDVTIPPNADRPMTLKFDVLAEGHGDEVNPGAIVVSRSMSYNWDGSVAKDLWTTNKLDYLTAEPLEATGAFVGQKVGTRYAMTIPVSAGARDARVLLGEIIATFPPTRQ
ncbi:MAG: FKBP-type peptidyl-prolyl cis-trans isomerase [Actinomycetaceae bacterium]|nr:FKBP-type peptidyl-prolyl cis-trans isomerase [Actinomycetaceae bacterium]